MIKVEGSSNIAAYDWHEVDQGEGNLDVRFHTGETYRYSKVPKGIWGQFVSAKSKGQFLSTYIIKAEYAFVKITTEVEESKTVEQRLDELERKVKELERQVGL